MSYNRSPYYTSLYNKGIMNLNSGNYAQALEDFEAAKRAWDNSYAYSGIGRAYYGLGRYQEALQNFETAYRRYSSNLQALHWRAKALGKLRRYRESEEQFKNLLSVLSNGPVNFHQEVLADYEDMKDERDGKISVSSNGRNVSNMYGTKSQPAPRIIVSGVSGPVNIGGIQATGSAIINRPTMNKDNQPSGDTTIYCPMCGKKVSNGDRFCKYCGNRL